MNAQPQVLHMRNLVQRSQHWQGLTAHDRQMFSSCGVSVFGVRSMTSRPQVRLAREPLAPQHDGLPFPEQRSLRAKHARFHAAQRSSGI